VTEETINLKVQHILQTLIAYGMLDKERKQQHRRGIILSPARQL